MAQFHEVTTFADFEAVIASLKDLKVPVFAEFYGAHDSSGKSWCPDCVKGTWYMLKCDSTKVISVTRKTIVT